MESSFDRARKSLKEIESALRFEFNDLIWTSTKYTYKLIRRANALCKAQIFYSLPSSHKSKVDLFNAKNLEIKDLVYLHKSKCYEITLLYLDISTRLKAIYDELLNENNDNLSQYARLLLVESGFFSKYTIRIFDTDLAYGPVSLLEFKNYNVIAAAQLKADVLVEDAFQAVKVICEVLKRLKRIKDEAKATIAVNNGGNVSKLLQSCEEIALIPIPTLYLFNKRWETTIISSEFLTLKCCKIKSMLVLSLKCGSVYDTNSHESIVLSLERGIHVSIRNLYQTTVHDEGGRNAKYRALVGNSIRKIFVYLDRNDTKLEIMLGKAFVITEREREAIKLYKRARKREIRENRGIEHIAMPSYLIGLGYDELNDFRKAEKWLERTVELSVPMQSKVFKVARLYDWYAYVLVFSQRYEKAEVVVNRWKSTSQRLTCKICYRLGHLYSRTQQFDLSEKWLKAALALKREKANIRVEYSFLCMKLERFTEAESLLHGNLYSKSAHFTTHASSFMQMGLLRTFQQRFDEAEQWLNRAEKYNEAWLRDKWLRARIWMYRGCMLYEIGRYAEAGEKLEQTLVQYFEKVFPGHLYTMEIYGYLARVNIARNEIETAEMYADKAVEVAGSIREHMNSASVYQCKAIICIRKGDLPGAVEWLEKAIRIQSSLVPSHSDTAATYFTFGLVHLHKQDLSTAETYFNQALSLQLARNPPNLQAADSYTALADVSEQRGDTHSAVRNLECAVELYSEYCPAHPNAAYLKSRINILSY